jgi:DNA-binding IclR family transcriptional regulator
MLVGGNLRRLPFPMIRAVERAFAIFEAFDQTHTMLTLQEIGKRIGLSKATTYRLVNCLHDLGYLMRLEDNRYCLSLKLTRLSGLVRSTMGIRDIARPIMLELVKKSGETVTLNTITGDQRICIEVCDTPAPLMSIVRPGEQRPLLYGATAKILLAYMSTAEVDRIFRKSPTNKRPNRALLDKQLARFRNQGYALISNEHVQGVTAVSVPIHDASGQVRYSVSIYGPGVRIDPRADELVRMLLGAGKAISSQLGARESDAEEARGKPERGCGRVRALSGP